MLTVNPLGRLVAWGRINIIPAGTIGASVNTISFRKKGQSTRRSSQLEATSGEIGEPLPNWMGRDWKRLREM